MNIFATQSHPKYNSLAPHPSAHTDNDSEKTLLESAITDDGLSTDTESTIEEDEYHKLRKPWRTLSLQLCITLLNLSLLAGSAFCYYQTFYVKTPLPGYTTFLNEDLKKVSYYSPLLDVIDVPSTTQQINGSLFPGRNPSIFRLPPSPEVDAAWSAVAEVPIFAIPSSAVRILGKDPARTVRLPESLGFPADMHLAQLDSAHQIHCLNALRKAVFASYYYDAAKKPPRNRLHWIHLSHCAGILLQNLMCQANLDVVTLNWVETQENPFPDFSVNKQCRDFGAIQRWQQEHRLSEEVLQKIVRQTEEGGYIELPPPVQNILDAFVEAETPWDFDWAGM
ncbi:hypothetical protein DRE_03910 [Drechslerella stenobrocha 248]|uniref:Uncharacterized protein n=1 Tax=Drechslerella stenobrocha 248 TaxID=1043628 RepID=W7I3V1_9PEZI|nr:hypothetical protein DRE_03910 [Drechslerella stenobrocha 248]